MAKVLHIAASPRPESYSTRVARAFVAAYRQAHPGDTVEELDLFKADIPPFLAPQAKAKYAVLGGEAPTGDAEVAWAGVIKVINHFKGFDKYILSSAMWNFGIPYRLKQYIDVIVQPGLTFAYSEKGPSGMLAGKPLTLILARGGVYGPGNPSQTNDFQESYLRCVLGFIGFADIKTIYIQGTGMNKPDQVESDTKAAEDAARKAGKEF